MTSVRESVLAPYCSLFLSSGITFVSVNMADKLHPIRIEIRIWRLYANIS